MNLPAHSQLLETPEKKRMRLALKEKAQIVFSEFFLFTQAHLETPQLEGRGGCPCSDLLRVCCCFLPGPVILINWGKLILFVQRGLPLCLPFGPWGRPSSPDQGWSWCCHGNHPFDSFLPSLTLLSISAHPTEPHSSSCVSGSWRTPVGFLCVCVKMDTLFCSDVTLLTN